MGNSGKNMRRLEQQLNASRQKGSKEVNLELSEAQAVFVRDELKLPISAIVYEIQTQQIENVTSTAGLLQEIHRAYKREQGIIRKSIRGKEFGVLKDAGVTFRPVKYRIVLSAT